jgi:ribosomal protein L21E
VPDLPWLVYVMLLAPLGLILIAAAVKTWQAREAKSWPQVAGKVVTSAAEVREVNVSDDDREDGFRLEKRNFANVVYEYAVNGRKLTCNRISIGEDLGNSEVGEKLRKYPAGSIVTVYYNPRHPDQAVLERDLPKGLWGCLGIGTGIVLAIVFGSVFGLNRSYQYLAHHIARPDLAGMVVGFGAFGLVVALMAWAVRRQAATATSWPVVPGTIKVSEMEQYREATADHDGTGVEMYGRRVSYTYSYQNVSYTNECARAASETPATADEMLQRLMSRYKDGASVEVHVNPDNPAEATLDAKGDGRFAYVLWTISAIFAGLALFVATRG